MCQSLRVAIVALRHFTKMNGPAAIHRGQGNIGFAAVARSVLAVREDLSEPGRAILCQAKNNLAGKGAAEAFRVGMGPKDVEFLWEGTLDATVAELFAAQEEEPGAVGDAKLFLLEILFEGPRPGKGVQKEVREAGIAEKTLRGTRPRNGS